MVTEPLTAVETAALFILMDEAAAVPNAKLARDHRCELKKASREKLERLKLIEVDRPANRIVLTLGDKGWAYCRAQLEAGAPPVGSGALGGALYALLHRWGRFLTARRLSLDEFLALSNVSDVENAPTPARPVGDRDVEERVRAAYRNLAGSVGGLVSLADLRDLISDLDSADVDAALRRLNRRQGVALVPEANQKMLDARARSAAVVIGDQPKHSISMEPS